jgi:hypothetical protein
MGGARVLPLAWRDDFPNAQQMEIKKTPVPKITFPLTRGRGGKYDVNGFILIGGYGEIHPR